MHQLLFYPVTGTEENLPLSLIEYANGYLLDEALIRWFQHQYFHDEAELTHPYASPIISPHLTKLPPTTLLTAEYDPLRDLGRAYANKLISLGVPVTYHNYGDSSTASSTTTHTSRKHDEPSKKRRSRSNMPSIRKKLAREASFFMLSTNKGNDNLPGKAVLRSSESSIGRRGTDVAPHRPSRV